MTPARRPVSAPGKAFLIGEYAVLEGVPALVTAVDVRAVAHDCDYPDRPAPSDLSLAAHAQVRDHLSSRTGPATCPPGRPRPLGEVPSVDTGPFSRGDRKLGLGSSAAVAAAVVGFHLQEAGHDLASADTRALALALARAAHHQAQGGGSGGDVAAAVLGGSLRFTRGSDPVLLAHPAWLHVGFVDAGAPANTAAFVRRVQAAATADPAAHARAIDLLTRASHDFLAAYALADPGPGMAAIRRAVDHHNLGLAALQALSGAPILTPPITAITDLARALGLAAKPTGAGGGDLVVVFAASQAELDRLGVRLAREHNLHLLNHIAVAAPGLRSEPRPPTHSRLGGFFKLKVPERRAQLAASTGLPLADFSALDPGSLSLESADNLIENVIGTLQIPLAVATNFRINGVDLLVPMAIEEASVVAAASNAARMVRAGGGFVARADPPWMIAQVQLCAPQPARLDATTAAATILAARTELLALADATHPRLVARGGGARELEVRVLAPDMLVVHAIVDCQDAMGANLLNTIAESLAPRLHELSGWHPGLRILSNLADRRCAHVSCRVPPAALAAPGWPGDEVAAGIASASRFAELDPYRAATHNKGVMNGVDAVVLATGNDWRAIEAGAHAHAARSGAYRPLATWSVAADGHLEGSISLPAAVGTVGGATKVQPSARLALQILGPHARTMLGQVMAAVGLASNLAALRALATEGIQRGHMGLHARSVAIGAGALGPEIEILVTRLIESGEVKHEHAVTLLRHLRQ
ncbi:hydroxymethylglutaryl-CoA reductase, degradative [Nannocystis sp.]|uniref:hydroxymethylglutaryl-CoA reductase, degradative n=1 Tax=Nannocystis sp. TaxID=1962667 RepID=UPI0025E08642|nr:hydroxymethylglutaryl-CoA reductase, degradative [Nannocystis sp.]MBK7824417.1 hydroxymethylglutaryl-CoA reductase, degradative [Nannocystis sp.]